MTYAFLDDDMKDGKRALKIAKNMVIIKNIIFAINLEISPFWMAPHRRPKMLWMQTENMEL